MAAILLHHAARIGLGLLAAAGAGLGQDPRLAPVAMTLPPGLELQLHRADELTAGGRPEAAVGLVADILRQQGGALAPIGPGWFLPLASVIASRLRGADPRERELWQLRFEAEARSMLRAALAEADPQGLREMARRHPGTAGGAEALLALGDLELHRGEPWLALACFRAAEPWLAEPARLAGRVALAWTLLGEPELARRELERLADQTGYLVVAGKALPLEEIFRHPAWPSPPPGTAAAVIPLDREPLACLWRRAVEPPRASPDSQRGRSNRVIILGQGPVLLPDVGGPTAPLDADGPMAVPGPEGSLVLHHREGLELIELATGRLRARFDPDPADPQASDPRANQPSLPGSGRGERIPVLAGDRVFLLTAPGQVQTRVRTGRPNPSTPPSPRRAVAAWSLGQERCLWSVRLTDLPQPLKEGRIQAGPAVTSEVAGILVAHDATFSLVGLEAGSGRFRWQTPLHGGGTAFLCPPAVPLLAHEGIIYAATGAGALAAVNAETGELLWLLAYPREEEGRPIRLQLPAATAIPVATTMEPRGFREPGLLLRGEVLVLGPPDGDYLLGVSAWDGRLLWRASRHDPDEDPRSGSAFAALAGADDERVYLAGRKILALEIRSGRRLWEVAVPESDGPPLVGPGGVILPSRAGLRLVGKDPPHRSEEIELPGRPAGPIRLALLGPFLLVSGVAEVGLWTAPRAWAAGAAGGERAQRLAQGGLLAEAVAALPPGQDACGDDPRPLWMRDLARRRLAAGETAAGLDLLQEAARTARRPARRLQLLEELGRAAEKAGRPEAAAQAFHEYLEAANQLTGRSQP